MHAVRLWRAYLVCPDSVLSPHVAVLCLLQTSCVFMTTRNTRWLQAHPCAPWHCETCRLGDLIARRDRCECAPTSADVKRCFWLGFDQQAFVAAALKTDEQLRTMFNERLVWDDPKLIAQMRMKGLLQRIYAPSVWHPFLLLSQNSIAWNGTDDQVCTH